MKITKEVIKCSLRWIGVFIICYAFGTLMFILLFHTPLFYSMNVLMYRGIVLLILSAVITTILLILLNKFVLHSIHGKDIAMMVMMLLCINMVLFTLLPVTVERSFSVYMLNYMSNHDEQVMTEQEIREVFAKKYLDEYDAIGKRFDEQIITGSIVKKGEGYVITDRGRFLAHAFRIIGKVFDTDQRLLYSKE